MYTAMYLPVDRPWTDGCTYIDSDGSHHKWDADALQADKVKERGKVAELFIVAHEFNMLRIIGHPSPAAYRWIKPGMQFKHFNVVETKEKVYHGNFDVLPTADLTPFCYVVNVRCEVCKHMD